MTFSLSKRRQKVPCTISPAVTSEFECKVFIFKVRLDCYTSHVGGPVGRWNRLVSDEILPDRRLQGEISAMPPPKLTLILGSVDGT